ncbi:MAG: argininosuccinate synthase [Phycisphaerales bacterium]|nr:argininosuccinate synthase [Phycisphaerales bacterium]
MMRPKVVLAFSGGLDTQYCAVWLREQGYDVHAITVNTGGFTPDDLAAIRTAAQRAGVANFAVVDGRGELFRDVIRYLIAANATRGGVYPLSVSAERVVQARRCAQHAVEIGAAAVAHGSTGAGNDQVRFDVALRVFAPGVQILTPIRDQSLSREQETAYLAKHNIVIPPKTTKYSVNRGLWGTTIGGVETHRSDGVLPEEAYVVTADPAQRPAAPQDVILRFDAGVPVAIDGAPSEPVALIERLNEIAARHGVGRGMHVGDTILGIKGRVAFEAPAPVTLLSAHRELEKLVLSRNQQFWKQTLGDLYGQFVHEARFFDPLMRDIEAFLISSQRRVTGDVWVRLHQGMATVLGATSEYSLMNSELALYGEASRLWTSTDAAGFSKLYGVHDELLARAGRLGDAARKGE